jgi:predicted NUDIX family NTP pyrophosphohydrolase
MPKGSAGPIAFHRRLDGRLWVKRDIGAGSIPEGEIEAGEDPLAAAPAKGDVHVRERGTQIARRGTGWGDNVPRGATRRDAARSEARACTPTRHGPCSPD